MNVGIALIVIGLIGIVDSLIGLSFPNFSHKVVKKLIKKKSTMIKAAKWELTISVLIFIIGMNV